MSWQDVMVPMVRHLINDLGTTQTFDDDRIEQAIVVSGLIAAQEYSFDTDYTFDVDNSDISPDPTETETLDNLAIALFVLKTACMLSMNQYQKAIGTGIRVRDGDSEVDTTGSFGGYKDILNIGPCSSYNKLIDSSYWSLKAGRGGAVFGPYSGQDSTWGRVSYYDVRTFFDSWSMW